MFAKIAGAVTGNRMSSKFDQWFASSGLPSDDYDMAYRCWNAGARAVSELLEPESERYRWLRKVSPYSLLVIAWGHSEEACTIRADCDAAIDAAMSETKA